MSPAPQRPRGGPDSFQGTWGYWFGLLFVAAGLIGGIVLVVGALTGFADDIRELRRVVDGGDLEVSLEQGEYLVFDEDGLDIGPFDVRVFRASDDTAVATSQLNDGLTYNVDGRSGRARVAFDVPTADIYRVEVDTSVGQAVRFAVGSDVGNARTNGLFRGVTFGLALMIIGLGAAIWTLIVHARWRIRSEVRRRASDARQAVAEVADAAGTSETRRTAAEGRIAKVESWTSDQVERVREAVTNPVDAGDPSTWRGPVGDSATQVLDDVVTELHELEADVGATVADAAAGLSAPADLLARIDEALGRVDERLVAGDSLRDIASDERALAAEIAEELTSQGMSTTGSAIEQATALRESLAQTVPTPSQVVPRPPPPPLPVATMAPPPPPPPPPLATGQAEDVVADVVEDVQERSEPAVAEPEMRRGRFAGISPAPRPRSTATIPQTVAAATGTGQSDTALSGASGLSLRRTFHALAPPPPFRRLAEHEHAGEGPGWGEDNDKRPDRRGTLAPPPDVAPLESS